MSRALSSSDSKASASGLPVSQRDWLVMRAILPEPKSAASRAVAGLLVHHILRLRLQRKHLPRAHQPAAMATILGEEQLEAGVHELGRGLVDHLVGVDLGARMAPRI